MGKKIETPSAGTAPGCWRKIHGGVVGLALVAGTVTLSPAAVAQDYDARKQTVVERPREAYDARGIPMGGFTLFPTLDVIGVYDDNIYAAANNEVDDFETIISPDVLLKSNWSRHELSLRGFANFHRFIDTSTENSKEYGALAELTLDLARDGAFTLDGGYERVTVERGDPEEAGRLDPEQVDILHGGGSFRQHWGRLIWTLSGNIANYDEAALIDEDKNRTEYSGKVRLAYEISPTLNAYAEPYYIVRDFDKAVDVNGQDRDSDLYGGGFGVAYDITGLLYGETTVGYYVVDFKDPRFDKDTGFSVKSETTWNPTPRTTFIATIARENEITNQPDASSRQITRGRLAFQRDLARNWIFRADGEYFREKFLETPREDKGYNLGVRLDYLIDRHFAIYVAARRESRDSTIPLNEYDENLMMLGIRAHM